MVGSGAAVFPDAFVLPGVERGELVGRLVEVGLFEAGGESQVMGVERGAEGGRVGEGWEVGRGRWSGWAAVAVELELALEGGAEVGGGVVLVVVLGGLLLVLLLLVLLLLVLLLLLLLLYHCAVCAVCWMLVVQTFGKGGVGRGGQHLGHVDGWECRLIMSAVQGRPTRLFDFGFILTLTYPAKFN